MRFSYFIFRYLSIALLLVTGFVASISLTSWAQANVASTNASLIIKETKFVVICPNPTFRDDNQNGVRDTVEPLINDLETILKVQEKVFDTIKTDGNKCFKPIEPGKYTVIQIPPTGNYNTTTGGVIKTVEAIDSTVAVPFGYQAQALICASPTFEDANSNQQLDAGEQRLINVLTKLLDKTGKVLDTLNSGLDNCFRVPINQCNQANTCVLIQEICQTEAGKCDFKPICPVEYTNLVVEPGQTIQRQFCYQSKTSQICAQPTFNDLNGDQLLSTGEQSIVGVKTELLSNKTVIGTLYTGAENCFTVKSDQCTSQQPCTMRQPDCPTQEGDSCIWQPSCPVEYSNLVAIDGQRLERQFCYQTQTKLICADPTFEDLDGNQQRGVNERSLSGVETSLQNATGQTVGSLTTGGNNCISVPSIECTATNPCILQQKTPSGFQATTPLSYENIQLQPAQSKSFQFGYRPSSFSPISLQLYSSAPQGPLQLDQKISFQTSFRNTSNISLTNVCVAIPLDSKFKYEPNTLRFGQLDSKAYSQLNPLLGSIQANAQSRPPEYNSKSNQIEACVAKLDPNQQIDITFMVVVREPAQGQTRDILSQARATTTQTGASLTPIISNTIKHTVVKFALPRTGGAAIIQSLVGLGWWWLLGLILAAIGLGYRHHQRGKKVNLGFKG